MATYIARLVTDKFRDVKTGAKKILLEKIINEDGIQFRDHCYVKVNSHIQKKLNCMRPGHKFAIQFEADTVNYLRRGVEEAQTLGNIRSIKVLGRV